MSLLAVSLIALLFCTVACSSGPGQCSKGVLHAWCSANTTLEVARLYLECEGDFGFLERRCRVNKQGDLCGSFVDNLDDVELASEACIDTTMTNCSNECRQRLEVVEDDVGCCINEMINNTRIGPRKYQRLFNYSLWSMCGVDTPRQSCPPSRLTKLPKPKSTSNCSFHEIFQRRYQVQCRSSTMKAFADDYNAHGCQQVAKDLYNTCSITEEGVWCMEKPLINNFFILDLADLAQSVCSSNGSTCTAECRSALQDIRSNVGCCINNLFNNTYLQLVYTEVIFNSILSRKEVWTSCGVTYPDSCKIETYSGARCGNFTWEVMVVLLIAYFLH